MEQLLKRSAKAVLRSLGYEVRRKGSLSTGSLSDPFDVQKRLTSELSKSNTMIFDIGANRGQTAQAYRARFPNAEIYCFEPFPDAVAALQQAFCSDRNIHIIPKAISEETRRSIFYVNGFDATNSLLPRPTTGKRYYPNYAAPKQTIEVEVVTLDEFVSENDISAIDILKFDIQGGELMALRGAAGLLKAGTVSLIYTEISFIAHYEKAPLFNEIWTFLQQFGYSLFNIYDTVTAANGQLRYGDALFVNATVRNKIIDKLPDEP
jgi:FkbM family methyltransferase